MKYVGAIYYDPTLILPYYMGDKKVSNLKSYLFPLSQGKHKGVENNG